MDPAKYAAAVKAGVPLPGPHTSKFEPLPQPTLEVGVKALSTVATSLLQ
jgi:hippurate hydrolase